MPTFAKRSNKLRAICLLWLVVWCTGCASQQHHIALMEGAEARLPPGADQVDMLVMSTRERSSVPGVIYTGERARNPSLYNLVVSIPPDKSRKVGEVQWPKGPKPDARTDFVATSELLQMSEPRPRITIFLSRDDKALALSRWLGGDIDRVGSLDPDKEPYRSKLKEFNIVVINLTQLKVGDTTNHTKFAESPEIVRLIGNRLIEGQEIAGSDLKLGEHISGASVGAAAKLGRSARAAFNGM
jgi:esterase/lipase superfamily enzyme